MTKKEKVLTKLLEATLLENGVTLNYHMGWKLQQIARETGFSFKDVAKVVGPLLHSIVEKGLRKPKRRRRGH